MVSRHSVCVIIELLVLQISTNRTYSRKDIYSIRFGCKPVAEFLQNYHLLSYSLCINQYHCMHTPASILVQYTLIKFKIEMVVNVILILLKLLKSIEM